MGPHNKDYSILGSALGSPCFGKLAPRHGHGLSKRRLKRGRSGGFDEQSAEIDVPAEEAKAAAANLVMPKDINV